MNTTVEYPATPNLDKAVKMKVETEAVGQFIEWLGCHKKIFLAEDVTRTVPAEDSLSGKEYTVTSTEMIRSPLERLLAEFIEVDYDAMNREQAAVLRYVQEKQ